MRSPCTDCDIFVTLAYIEKEDTKKLKQKEREPIQPKMGKMDIDYQVPPIHDSTIEAHQVERAKRDDDEDEDPRIQDD
ncbi:hypothetical protein Taro_043119 [Colocasia esculenta]|uniref:DUF382 domain-containing protein n=1 Tax=Colocasia esculenta TaxID=4460 RepID=A0A843X0V5_COLES|nr:hypothetical protein [Colocasia esculenta]